MKRQMFCSVLTILFGVASAPAADATSLLARIKSVGREGKGNVEAAQAWKALVRGGPAVLPQVLGGLDDANPTAANWIRSAVEAIADQAKKQGKPLPKKELEAFIKDKTHAGPARRLAYEVLVGVDPTAPSRFIPTMLNDPSQELRRDAVALAIGKADALLDDGKEDQAKAAYTKVLSAARDKDQVDHVAKQLKKLGMEVDLAKHFGYILDWKVATPFNNVDGVGFVKVYPPEKGVDLTASYKGKDGTVAKWKDVSSKHRYGQVDLNKLVAKHKGAVAYAYTVVDSPKERPVELRAASPNAIKMFLNGKQVFFREEYHHGNRMDQHVGRGVLKAGRNEVLVKVCQNEQTESWAQTWAFSLRICDDIGGAVPVKVVSASGK